MLEEIVVTATKRAESLQDVSLAVIAVTGATLQEAGIVKFDDLELPGIHIGSGGANDSQFIRGIGSGTSAGFEQSAPIFSDGVWFGRTSIQRLAFLDVARVEILKGPQPTYLGKNAIAGAVTVVSNRPTDAPEGGFDVQYEVEHEEAIAGGFISGPIAGNLKGRLAARYRDIDGWMTNLATGTHGPQQEDLAVRGSLLWDPSDRLSIFTKLEYATVDAGERETQLIKCLPGAPISPAFENCAFDTNRAVLFDPAVWTPPGIPYFDYQEGNPETRQIELLSGLAQVDWDLGAATFTSISAYYDTNTFAFIKPDHNVFQRVAIQSEEVYYLFSEELRLTSTGDDKLSWMAGAYFDSAHLDNTNTHFANLFIAGGLGFIGGFDEDDESWSVFSEVGYEFSDAWKIEAGFRFTEVQKEADASTARTVLLNPMRFIVLPPTLPQPALFERKESSFDPVVTIEWRPQDDSLFYASYRQGFKSGGFNQDLTEPTIAANQFRPEEVDYYELGGKVDFAGGAARLNFAIFRGEYTDLQVSALNPASLRFTTQNAGESRSQGVELEAEWAATAFWQFAVNLVYLDAEYVSFPSSPCYVNPIQTLAEGCRPASNVVLPPGATFCPVPAQCQQDASGKPLSYAPEWSGSFAASFNYPVGGSGLEFFGRLDVFGTTEFFTDFDLDPDVRQPGYAKFDAQFGFLGKDARWRVAVVGRNLGDKLTAHFIGDQVGGGNNAGHFAIIDRTRQIGLQAAVNFE